MLIIKEIHLKLSDDEQLFFDKIKAISRKDAKTLKDVFISMLQAVSFETYANKNNNFTIHIPYICTINVEYFDRNKYTAEGSIKGQYIDFKITTIPSESFIAEVNAISYGDEPPSKRYIKKQIINKNAKLLGIDDLEIED
jgi:hypothetical protein